MYRQSSGGNERARLARRAAMHMSSILARGLIFVVESAFARCTFSTDWGRVGSGRTNPHTKGTWSSIKCTKVDVLASRFASIDCDVGLYGYLAYVNIVCIRQI